AAGLDVAVTTSIDTGIGTAMALHVAAAVASSYAAGLATASLLQSDLLRAPLEIAHGAIQVPQRPGRGVGVNQARLRKDTGGGGRSQRGSAAEVHGARVGDRALSNA